ncbi:MAG TPA: hypothetical protein VM915_15395 [Verrucomicrobiae bacterium]|nr:hypothetical protein [Verrucomicrobiae bacterium]
MKWMSPDIAEAAAAHYAFTAIDDRGRIVGCGGIAPADQYLVAWAVFSQLIEAHRFAITRAVRQSLDLHRTCPVVAHIHPEHGKAARFAEALDFRFLEARADLHPSGALLHVYVREGV